MIIFDFIYNSDRKYIKQYNFENDLKTFILIMLYGYGKRIY